jgi:acyl-ACP thioesterase
MSNISIYQDTFKVRAYEVDVNNQLSVVSLANYLQEAAGEHARILGIGMLDLHSKRLAWVLMRLKLNIIRQPSHLEEITVQTYPTGFEKIYVYRDFQVFDAKGNLIAFATSTWLVIDIEKRSMVRVPNFILNISLPSDRAFFDPSKNKISKIDLVSHSQNFKVRFHDLDINRHVNNAYYFQWMLESLPIDFLAERQLQEIDLLFRIESTFGDELESINQKLNTDFFIHSLHRPQDQKELAQATTLWINKIL